MDLVSSFSELSIGGAGSFNTRLLDWLEMVELTKDVWSRLRPDL